MTETLEAARQALDETLALIDDIASHFTAKCTRDGHVAIDLLDQHQIALFDFARFATECRAADQLLPEAGRLSTVDTASTRLLHDLAVLYAAEVVHKIVGRLSFREAEFGLSPAVLEDYKGSAALISLLTEGLQPQKYEAAAELLYQLDGLPDDELGDEYRALQLSFRRFAADKVMPLAEHIHREDQLVPDELINDLRKLGCFGFSIPARYGGQQVADQPDHLAMVIVSDELSRASFGTAGSLITRPELLAKALLKGGTEAQKEKWLPLIASGEQQVAVAVTEPDHGSDVAHLRTRAIPVEGGWRLNGTKTWCTLAGRAEILMVLARSDPDPDKAHRGLSLFIVEKPPAYGYSFEHSEQGGRITGRAIATLGYRGMHSFEVSFEDIFVPAANLIGGEAGLGQGFYLQMHGFAGSRIQTAGRALGVMTAAFQSGLEYARQRQVFGRDLSDYSLSRRKLARMAMMIAAARHLVYHAARELDRGAGSMDAAMAKFLTARAAEWITREAQQLHGGMGYAEEFPISRHFVDARLLAIFEGTDEILALRVIARALLR